MAKFGENTLLSEAAFKNEEDARNQLKENNLNYDNYNWTTQDNMHFATDKKQLEQQLHNGSITPNELPEGSLKKEAEQLYDSNPHNDVIRDDAFDEFVKQQQAAKKEPEVRADLYNDDEPTDFPYSATPVEDSVIPYRLKPGSHWNRKYGEYLDGISSLPTSKKHAVYEILHKLQEDDTGATAEDLMNHNHWMDSDTAKAIEYMSSEGYYPVMSKEIWNKQHPRKSPKQLEDWIESNPNEAQQELTAANEPEAAAEAAQVTDGNPHNSEVRNDVMERLSEDFANVDELNDYLVDWDKVKVYQPGEDPYYQVHDDYDPRVEKMLNNWNETEDEPNEMADEPIDDSIVDYGLEDQNQYQDRVTDEDIARADETVYDPQGIYQPELTNDMLEPAPELPYADNVFQVKQQAEEVPETEQSEQSEYGLPTGILTAKPNGVGGSSIGTPNAPDYHAPGSVHSGVAVGTHGILPHGALSYSSASSATGATSPSSVTDAHQSPAAIKDSISSAGTTVVSGKQAEASGFTSSNGGNIESGATAKSGRLSSVGSSLNLPGFTGHTGGVAEGLLGAVDDLKKALIERVKNMIDQLPPDIRKEMGFSPTLYSYQGIPLNKLDGDTLHKLSEQLEKITSQAT